MPKLSAFNEGSFPKAYFMVSIMARLTVDELPLPDDMPEEIKVLIRERIRGAMSTNHAIGMGIENIRATSIEEAFERSTMLKEHPGAKVLAVEIFAGG